MIELYNMDCMDAMKEMPDNAYDLAIVDPPYGIGESGGVFRARSGQNKKVFDRKDWDNETPSIEYFNELQRVSANQIIWGGNYFTDKLPVSRCWIYWDKLMGGDFSDGELAWTSFDAVLRKFTKCNKDHGKIHPTQKPVKLYEWLLTNYAKEGDKILDTHLGSGSIAIACHNLKFDLTGYELDAEYYEAATKRLTQHQAQQRLF
jgi:site-specific DNA-methyltransferase (adenine-specific)